MLVHDGLEAGWHAMWRPLFGHNADERTVAAAATWAGEQRLDDIVAGVRAFHDRRDLRSFANDWNGPIVVISGDQDRTPAPSAARLHGRRRRFHLVDDCGHYVNLEQPDRFATLLAPSLAWIASLRTSI